jgi:signal transduction histidine kinase
VEQLVWSVLGEAHLADAHVEVKGGWVPVPMPEAAVRSVLANLISNASHYGREKSGRLELTITGYPSDEVLVVVVEDQGSGIDDLVADRIFEPFVTAPDSSKLNPSSTGLGLAVVGRTLERHGGKLELVRGRQVGTAFRISAPVLAG